MSYKKIPPPPILPPIVKLNDEFCLFHKGNISGEFYICPSCKTKYCLECAKEAKNEGKLCIKCKQLVLM